MACGVGNQEMLPESLRKQLALAVKSIHWSYAIFWSVSPEQPNVLKWSDGFYNGDIKTRKTVQAAELDADQSCLRRSEQLRELYESLSAVEADPQARRPAAALSPEDLSDTEWYYLVCMSFVFGIGQGLPGKTLASGCPIWLCNADNADSKAFCRSLLAKSASVQTVVCFPFLEGVLELGVTEAVSEDYSLIQHVKTSFLETEYSPTSTRKSNPEAAFNQEIIKTNLNPAAGFEELEMTSPLESLNGFETNQPAEDAFLIDGINGEASQVQSWQFMDDEFGSGIHNSMHSSDCISRTFLEPEKVMPIPMDDNSKDHLRHNEDCGHAKQTSVDLQSNDLHYQSVLSAVLKTSHQLILGPHFQNTGKESSFICWKKNSLRNCQEPKVGTPQELLKKILFEVPRMHGRRSNEFQETNRSKVIRRPDTDELGLDDDASLGRTWGDDMNARFLILRSMVPSISKVDNTSVLDDTIEYLKELQKRVRDLESRREYAEPEATLKKKRQETIEGTSDNRSGYGKKLINKRKAGDIDDMEQSKSSAENIAVRISDKDVVIKMSCPWREGVFLEVVDALSNNYGLDSHSVQSSTINATLHMTIKSQFKGSNVASAGTIKDALQRISRNF